MPKRRRTRLLTPARVIASILLGGMAAAWLRERVSRFEAVDHSMSPALAPGDCLITVRPGRRGPRRGDIAVFRAGGRRLIKRVIGLPGERIRIEGGIVTVDGAPLAEPWWAGATRPNGEWRIPAGAWFVMGDNRPRSGLDSRTIGPVDRRDLHSIALFRYLPLRRAGLLRPRSDLLRLMFDPLGTVAKSSRNIPLDGSPEIGDNEGAEAQTPP